MYFDYNAGAPLLPEVAELLAQAFLKPANASSIHAAGRDARRRLDNARQSVAQSIGCLPKEVVFTASGSEAASLAIKGAYAARTDKKRDRVVLSSIEHPCVMLAAAELESQGADVVRIAPQPNGQVLTQQLLDALSETTALCSLMWVNNETGVIQPVEAVSRHCRSRGIVFHCDAVQAIGKVEAVLRQVPADLLSFSGHKFGGPAGSGVLYVRRGVSVKALTPGHQEDGIRGGTQSVALAEGLALALTISQKNQVLESERLGQVRDSFERGLQSMLAGVEINGRGSPRVSNTSNLQIDGVDAETLLVALDLDGHCVSTGAACSSGSLTPSHVLTAMGLSATQARSSLRISFGRESTASAASALAERIAFHVHLSRTM
jgi:cysteine desulfurase